MPDDKSLLKTFCTKIPLDTSTHFRKSPWDIFIWIVLMQLIRILKVDFYRQLDIEANVTWTRAWLQFHQHHVVAHTLQFNLLPANFWFYKIPFLLFPCLEQKILQALNATVAAHLEQFGPDLLLYDTKLGASLKPLNRPPAASPIIEIWNNQREKHCRNLTFLKLKGIFLQMKFTIKKYGTLTLTHDFLNISKCIKISMTS